MVERDGFTGADDPLGRKRHGAQGTEEREGRRHGDERQADGPRGRVPLEEDRVGLLGADDADRQQRDAILERDACERLLADAEIDKAILREAASPNY